MKWLQLLKINREVRGFTLPELMITLALTSVLVGFLYSGMDYSRKMFHLMRKQNDFILELCELKTRFIFLSNLPKPLIKKSENNFELKQDSTMYSLEILKDHILLSKNEVVDTFHIKAENLRTITESTNSSGMNRNLINEISFDIHYQNLKYCVDLTKENDACSRLKSRLEKNESN